MAVIYRLWNDQDELLYIGSSKSALSRLTDHLNGKEWASEISSVTLEHFSELDDARSAEIDAIHFECPKYNIQHRSSWQSVDPVELSQRLTPAEKRRFASLLSGLVGYLPACTDHYCSFRESFRVVAKWLYEPSSTVEQMADLMRLLRYANLLGLGDGYRTCEGEEPPTDQIRDGIDLSIDAQKMNLHEIRFFEEEYGNALQ
jgi:hypothetical protein